MFEKLLWFPGSVYQAQLGLSATGLIVEFTIVFTITFLVGNFRCTTRSPVNWKRTDYFYFGTTVLAAAIGIAEFTTSSWNREVQNLRMERAATIEQLKSGARWIDDACERKNRRDAEKSQRFGIVPPTETDYLYQPTHPRPEIIFSTRHCETAKFLAIAFDETVFITIVNEIVSTRKPTVELQRTEDDEYFFHFVRSMGLFKPTPVPPEYGYEGLILTPSRLIVESNSEITTLEEKINDLSSTNIFRRLYPILFGLGLGVRLARTHYDVQMSKKEELKKRAETSKDHQATS